MRLDGKWERNFSGLKAKSREALKTQQLPEQRTKPDPTEGLLKVQRLFILLKTDLHHITTVSPVNTQILRHHRD